MHNIAALYGHTERGKIRKRISEIITSKSFCFIFIYPRPNYSIFRLIVIKYAIKVPPQNVTYAKLLYTPHR